MINVTSMAVCKVKEILVKEDQSGEYGLRLAVVGGGCSGMQYKLGFDKERKGDKVLNFDGLKVMVDMKSAIYLTGSELDYVESLMGAGFKINNPNVKSSCGCGESFSA